MLKSRYVIFLIIAGLMLSVDSFTNTAQAQWYNAYKSGLKAMDRGDWQQGVSWLTQALNKKSKDTKKIRAKGVMFIEYYPNRELGICYFNLGQAEKALHHLTTSLRQVRTRRATKYLTRLSRGDHPKPVASEPVISEPIVKAVPRTPVSRRKQPSHPAQLAVNLFFVEPSNNGFLDAEEAGKIIIDLSNKGRGDAYDLQVKVSTEGDVPGLTIGYPRKIDHLAPGVQESVVVPIQCGASASSRQVRLKIAVSEANGFDLDPPSYMTLSTQAGSPPELVISEIGINDNSQNRRIEPREMVDITARIKNTGRGQARLVKASVQAGANVFLTPESKTAFDLGDLGQGEYKDVTFTVFTNSKASSVPVDILLTESRGRFDKTLPLDLPFGKPQVASKDFVVRGGTGPDSFKSTPLTVDVDQNIPKSRNKNSDAIAIILGVESYSSIPGVTFAKRDAAIFKEYATSVLGVPNSKNNVYYRTDQEVTKGELLKLFTGNGWLKKRAHSTSDVYIFFAGHGAPDIKDESPYLIPFDGDANYPSQTGFSLALMYEELARLNAKSVTVFLDACFSGGTRENRMLLADARPVLIKVKNPILLSDKLVVFSASSGSEISSGYPDMKHGLFTYFLLKGLRGEADGNRDATLTVAELESYVVTQVSRTAGTLDREQTPQVVGRNKSKALVNF